MQRVETILCLHFAALTVLAGLLMGTGAYVADLWVVAVFAAVVSFVFVDWLRWVSLPMPLAYAAMAAAAVYCMGDFIQQGSGDLAQSGMQLTSVARLLVWVQAALLFQRKSRRIFEQVGMFCLLEVVVAAVLNDAIVFGLLLIPLAILALSGLVLLQIWDPQPNQLRQHGPIHIRSETWSENVAAIARDTPRLAAGVLGPAVLIFALVFFYTLPRTSSLAGTPFPSRSSTTGFSDSLQLTQLGRLLQNSAPVLRIRLHEMDSGDVYRLREPMYLRGQTLERYEANGTWKSSEFGVLRNGSDLPREYIPTHKRFHLFDRVDVQVTAEPISSNAAFAVAPYYATTGEPHLHHSPNRWLLKIPDRYATNGRNEYFYGTNAFYRGRQTEWLRFLGLGEGTVRKRNGPRDPGIADLLSEEPVDGIDPAVTLNSNERSILTSIDRTQFPSLVEEARSVVQKMPKDERDPAAIAKRLERHLRQSGGYSYTLNLSFDRVPGMDPIEQFVVKDRRGHCQYFASALAMMLRSQHIPARLVSGFKTNEFNELGGHYTARQLHAHAWVEAFIEQEQLPESVQVDGQPREGGLWFRLDPTPGGATNSSGNVDSALDLAQVLWDDYVVDLNSSRQPTGLFSAITDSETNPYSMLARRLEIAVVNLRSGQLGGGQLSLNRFFSWRTAVLVFFMLAITVALYQMLPALRQRRVKVDLADAAAVADGNSVDFYVQLKQLLASVGLRRDPPQTPQRWLGEVSPQLDCADPASDTGAGRATCDGCDERTVANAFQTLAQLFYLRRYGGVERLDAQQDRAVQQSLECVRSAVQQQQTLSNGSRKATST